MASFVTIWSLLIMLPFLSIFKIFLVDVPVPAWIQLRKARNTYFREIPFSSSTIYLLIIPQQLQVSTSLNPTQTSTEHLLQRQNVPRSPAKISRDVKRMSKFNEKMSSKFDIPALTQPILSVKVLPQTNISSAFPKPMLSIEILPHTDIPPVPKTPTCSSTTLVSISPVRRNLSRCNQLASESVPGLFNEGELTNSTCIDGFTHRTIFICKVCNTDHYRSTLEIKKHLKEIHGISIQPSMNCPFEARYECFSQ